MQPMQLKPKVSVFHKWNYNYVQLLFAGVLITVLAFSWSMPVQAWSSGDSGPTATTVDCTSGGTQSNTEPPSCLFAQPFGNAGVAVAWQWAAPNTSDNVTRFEIYRCEGSCADPNSNPTGWQNIGRVPYVADGRAIYSFLDSGPLKASTQYSYSVRTVRPTELYSPYFWSSTTSYHQPVTFPPRPVQGVTVTDHHNGSVTVSWQANPEPNISSYRIYRSDKSVGGTWQLVQSTSSTTFTDSGLQFYKDYFYRITAVDSTGAEGPPSVQKRVFPEPQNPSFLDGSQPWSPPHGNYFDDTSKCTVCHGLHSSPSPYLLKTDLSDASTVASLCFTCHDGTGSNKAVKAEFLGPCSPSNPGCSGQPSADQNRSDNGSVHPVLRPSSGPFYYGLQIKCTNCHSAHLDPYATNIQTQTPKLLSPRLKEMAGQQPFFRHKKEGVCYTCHGNGTLPEKNGRTSLIGNPRETEFEQSAHKNHLTAPSPTLIRCLYCHRPHGTPNERLKAYERPYVCFQCHQATPDYGLESVPIYHDHKVDSSDPAPAGHSGPPDIYSLIAANPKDADTRHDMWPYDDDPAKGLPLNQGGRDPQTAITCTNCHNPHTVQRTRNDDGTYNAAIHIDPYAPKPDGVWNGAVEGTWKYPGPNQTRPNGTAATQAEWVIGFCWRCHDNTLPTASDTLPWAPAPSCGTVPANCGSASNSRVYENIRDTWWTLDDMGYQNNTSGDNLISNIDRAQWPRDPENGQVLPCTVCHDPHGSPNPYRLKPFIRLKKTDGTYETKGPLLVYRFPPDPTPSGPPVDIDPRFFCGACHNRNSMGFLGGFGSGANTFPVACTRCHGHGTTDTPRGY